MQSLLHPPAAPHPCGCPGPSPRPRPRCGRPPRDVCRRVGWDPEGVLGPPVEGHIARREYSKKLRADEAFLAAEERRLAKAAAVKQAERDARAPPAAAPQLVEYLLNTPPEDMDFELTPAFFAALRSSVTSEKLSARRNDARLAELEGLLAMVESGVAKADENAAKLAAPAERLRALLQAPNKKEAILALVAANQVDGPLLLLLEQNIAGAQQAGQQEAAAFMEKIRLKLAQYAIESRAAAAGAAAEPKA